MHHPISTLARVVFATVSLTLLSARPAESQGAAPRRPSGGLFGATRSDVSGGNKLNFTFELAEGIDSVSPSEQGVAVVGGGLAAGGFSTLFGASSAYARSGRLLQLAGSASTAFRYYQQLDRLDGLSHGASLGMRLRLPKQGRFEINQAAAYSPSYLYQLFPQVESPLLGALIPLNPDYRIDQSNSHAYWTKVALELGSPRVTQLTTSGEYQVSSYENETAVRPGLEIRAAGASVSRALSRVSWFVLGYRYRTGWFEFEGPSQEHETTIGVVYSPALSTSRRLTVRLNATPAWLRFPASARDTSTAGEIRLHLYRLQGDAHISYPFKPNWHAAVAYDRGVQYLLGLSEPLLSDSVRAGLSGLIARRLDLAASAGYATATSAQSGANQNLDTYTGTVKIRFALKRAFALYSEYLYYYYDQRAQSYLAPGLPSVFEQHAVRMGLTVFIEGLGR